MFSNMLSRTRKGFTLIELMIVVAIIGILAAVAVPAFIRYIKDSKTTEAKTNLKSLSDGAQAYYQEEHPADAAGLSIFTKTYPGCEDMGAVTGSTACTDAKLLSADPSVGVKTAPNATGVDFTVAPWARLKFSISKPFYYNYRYVSKPRTEATANDSAFSAKAEGSLDKAIDSAFTVTGQSSAADGAPIVGAIIDVSVATGGTAAAPTLPGGD